MQRRQRPIGTNDEGSGMQQNAWHPIHRGIGARMSVTLLLEVDRWWKDGLSLLG
jgi:hypothetical protein